MYLTNYRQHYRHGEGEQDSEGEQVSEGEQGSEGAKAVNQWYGGEMRW